MRIFDMHIMYAKSFDFNQMFIASMNDHFGRVHNSHRWFHGVNHMGRKDSWDFSGRDSASSKDGYINFSR